MNEFEKTMIDMLGQLNNRIDNMDRELNSRIDNMERDMNDRFERLEEETRITRAAANYNGEKLDELVSLLKETSVIA